MHMHTSPKRNELESPGCQVLKEIEGALKPSSRLLDEYEKAPDRLSVFWQLPIQQRQPYKQRQQQQPPSTTLTTVPQPPAPLLRPL